MDLIWLLSTALVLGASHALEVDHMVAVTAFVGSEPSTRKAAGFGVLWGLGHSIAVFVLGSALVLVGLSIPASWSTSAERLVGVMLLALGAWAWRRAGRIHVHPPDEHGDHGHLHAHPGAAEDHGHHHHRSQSGRHAHATVVVGAIHGLAGLAPLIALVQVTAIGGLLAQTLYLGAFGVGTMVGMGSFGALAAAAMGRLGRNTKTVRAAAKGAAALAFSVGVLWVSGVF